MNGYYTVDQVVYHNKIDALYASSKSGSQVHWHWHKEYDSVPWGNESPYSLNEIYRRRAQQLRDKYDWLILSFSGGSDSWTVLNSFISNNIHLDEIFVRWPIKATQNIYSANSVDTRPENILSEWDLTIVPELKNIQKNYPNIKITITDWSDQLLNFEYQDDVLLATQDQFNPTYWLKFGSIGEHEQHLIDCGKSTCVIFGTDKPQICVKENNVYCYFIDIIVNVTNALPHPGRVSELFYWTPDCPEITHTQARIIYNYLKLNPQIGDLINWNKPYSIDNRFLWDQLTKKLIYPDYGQQFQAKKALSSVYSRLDYWLFEMPNNKLLPSWESMINNLVVSIDKKYLQFKEGKFSGFTGFISPLYHLGELPVLSS
jgi:hypothetical protein